MTDHSTSIPVKSHRALLPWESGNENHVAKVEDPNRKSEKPSCENCSLVEHCKWKENNHEGKESLYENKMAGKALANAHALLGGRTVPKLQHFST